MEVDITLHKLKYRNRNKRKRFPPKGQVEPGGFTWVFSAGINRVKSGGNQGNVGRVARRRKRWPEGIKARRRAI